MLSPAHKDIVSATLPLVGGAIGEITPNFYRRLFAAHPELERDLFNRGNQASGAQQAALAGAVAMYATMLVTEDAQERALIERIAHKHASLGVAPDAYPIVYEHLFAAIVEVLGAETVTAPVAEAWTAVYWEMADALIGREQQLYSEAGSTPETTWIPVVVAERIQQSPATVALTLTSADGSPLPDFRAGQYISVAVRLPDGARQIRQYSLSHAAGADRWRISVRREGEVSSHLHEYAFEGVELSVSRPFGDVYLDSEPSTPLLLMSAGIGITPVLGMLYALAEEQQNRPVTVVHADRTRATHAHRREITELVDRIPGASLITYYDELPADYPVGDGERIGRIDLQHIDVPSEANVYLCGPAPFMDALNGQLAAAAVAPERVYSEAFTPVAS